VFAITFFIMANNNPSTSAVQGDFQASTMAENHQHLFSSNNLSNTWQMITQMVCQVL
jgi:hypothetical protein